MRAYSSPGMKKFVREREKAYPPKGAIASAAHEMKENPPAILAKTRRKEGKAAAERQRVAIMLSKARRGS